MSQPSVPRPSAGAGRSPSGAHDARSAYCRRLGHPVSFRYCRLVADGLPCGRLPDCWFEIFDVAAYLRDSYSAEETARALRPPQGKVSQILDILHAIQGRGGTE